jgi:hypothetical protein
MANVWQDMPTDALLNIKANCESGIIKTIDAMVRGERGEFIDIAAVVTRSALDQINAELARRASV